ncbi:carbohydrate sulfotransferase 3 [Strongylocentrotus purpuratus]|uniref:Sulfotransferase domain-containing protein n=1 Tax=Strongylocentrotus purpuratus TaxID=7668 RepID=A0A7M7GG03_STRPU|nr:carbohydrate sulfotransferase 3 [Strongylocentrotus purpuratus]
MLKLIVKIKPWFNILLCVVVLALLHYILSTVRDLGHCQNTRDAMRMFKGEIHVKTHRSDSISSIGRMFSYLEKSESDSGVSDEYETESVENDVREAEEKNLEQDPRVEISGGDVMGTVSVSSHEKPVVIIILAQWRFGSSVIGELFNQNSGIFFLYEPLWVVEQMVTLWRLPGPFTPETYFYRTKLMVDFANCNFSDEFIGLVNFTNNWGGKFRNRVVCERTDAECNIPDAEWLRNVCLKYEGHLAAKLIRGDLNTIKPLVVDGHFNVKVIHLVRDPRGSAASRINYLYKIANKEQAHPKYSDRLERLQLLDFEIRHSDSITGMCQWVRETTHPFGQTPEWLKDRYYLLKYEDFANDPTMITEELYKFVGLELPTNVRHWVYRNTQAKKVLMEHSM